MDPNGVILDILDPQLDHYPFVFMSNVGNSLNQQEIVNCACICSMAGSSWPMIFGRRVLGPIVRGNVSSATGYRTSS